MSRKIYKKVISGIIAASMIFSVFPAYAVDDYSDTAPTIENNHTAGNGEEVVPSENLTETITETTGSESETNAVTEITVTESETDIVTETDLTEVSETTATIDEVQLYAERTEIQLNKVSETDSSITISWSGVYGETFSHYEVHCNGAVVQTGITDTTYTVSGLAGGNEYGISVYAYDVDGNIIGMSEELRACTNLTLQQDMTLYEDIIVQNLYLNSGTLNVNGHTITVKNDLGIGSGTLFVNGGRIYVEHTFRQQWTNGNSSHGYLKMTNPDDYICVNGDYYNYAYYGHSGCLTNGTLEVKGNFTQRCYSSSYNFCASDSHRVILSGEKLQTVSFDRTESRFNILDIRNFSAEGVVFATSVTINKLIENGCNITFMNGERSGWTLEADETIEGDLFLARGTLDLNGHKLTVTGNLIHSGGTVLVNGGELEVQGDYRVQALNGTNYTNSTGVLNMTNEADTVRVMGQFVMQSTASHSGKLTAGTLEIGGNLTQVGAYSYNFCTSGSHTVVLNGTEKQTVSINSNYRDYSRINNLKITNTSDSGVNFATKTYVVGNLYNTEAKVDNALNIYVASTTKFPDNEWNHAIRFVENYTLQEDLHIEGLFSLEGGTLNLNGHTLLVDDEYYLWAATLFMNGGRLEVGKNFYYGTASKTCDYGHLQITNKKDYLLVNGNFTVHAWYGQEGFITAGTIEIKGDFNQYKRGNDYNFYPSGTNKVILSGDKLQTVNFASTGSRFNVLEIQNYSEEGVKFATSVSIVELIDNGCNVSFANGERSGWTLEADETIEGDVNLARGTLDLNGHKLTITGNLVHSGGTVLVNGGELEVQGDYRVQALNGTNYTNSTGVLNMTNEADTVRVMGQFVMQSTASHSGKLTAGTLEIGGNLTQAGANAYNFCTSGNHTVVLNGTEKQTVSISSNSRDYSRFNNLKITNTSDSGVNFATRTYVVGNLYNTQSVITNGINIYVPTSMVFADNEWSGDIQIVENRVLSNDLTIGGTVYLTSGTLTLNGHKLLIGKDFNIQQTNGSCGYGYIIMKNAEDYVCVSGNFILHTYYANNTLTDGVLEVKGSFTQNYYKYGHAHNFNPSGNHKTILSGTGNQKVNFASTTSQFNILEITKPLETGYVFSRTPLWNELVEGKGDTEVPTAPKNLKFVRSNSSSIVMSWGASTDNAGIYCYYIYRNGERIDKTTELQYIDNDLKSHTYYEYYVVACDTSGNLSEWSNIIEASTDVDAFAPTQPKNLTAKVQSEGVVRLSWTASSDNGIVVKYNVYRNGTLIGTSNGTAYTDSTAFGGYYEYYVEAVDNEDNVSRASDSVFIDNLAPAAPVLTLDAVKDDHISLSWECSDNVSIEKYDVYRNGVKIKSINTNVYIDTAVSLDTNYTYYVTAYDAAGNVSENSNEVSAYTGEDDAAPVISSIEYAGKPSLKNAVIRVSATDNCGVAKVYLKYSSDKINWTDCGAENASGKASVSVSFGVDTSAMTDGTIYICACAEDINGNISTAEGSPVYRFNVDNTAPDAPKGVVCTSENDTIEVKWEAAEGVSYYRLYRKSGNGEYELLKDNYRYINYFESDIELGTVYTYKVTALDENGNESDFSDEVTGCISEDKTKPQVFSIYPENGSRIGENPEISISCYDNFKLKDVTVQGKAENANEWTDLYYKEINVYGEVVSFTLDTSEFETGNYQVKVSLTDSALNKSEDYIATYDYRKCTLSAPVLSAEGAGWSVDLSWTMENTEEIAGYYVYRRSSSSAKYSVIGSTTKNTVTDYDVTAGQKYYYYIEAMDIRGNKVKGEAVSAVPTSEDTIKPTAYAGEGLFGIAEKPVSFDGTGSADNHYVASYKWDFGDGTTSDEAKPKHTYSAEGTYTVSLTVYDSAGNSDTVKTEIVIYNKNYQAVKMRVRGSDGALLSGARVYCELTGKTIDATTDSSGCYDFIAKEGTYDVYFYKSGYLPVKETVTVTGEAKVVNVTLKKGEVVVGSLTTRPLELKEILALGIDPKAPENQSVCEYTVNLTYDKENKTLWLTTNAKGEIIKINETFNEKWQVYPYVIRRGGGNGSSGGEEESKSIALFSITTEISWMKEFYNVDLTVINNADDNFALENCTADLNLPSGLSLANTDRGENPHIKAGMIAGGETKSMSWVVRGDKKGEYYLTADFNCVLTPFMEDIHIEFKNEKPLVVYGGDALQLDVDYTGFDPDTDYWTAKFTLTNISNKPVYDVNIDFRAYKYFDDIEISDMVLEYPSGLKIHIPWTGRDSSEGKSEPDYDQQRDFYPALYDEFDDINSKTLNPGESITGYYSVSNFQHHIPR